MSATSQRSGDRPDGSDRRDVSVRRPSTETKAAVKTTEMIAYVVVLVGILVAGLATNSSKSPNGVNHPDAFGAHQVWLYATILTVGYMISRGLAKAGSKQHYDER